MTQILPYTPIASLFVGQVVGDIPFVTPAIVIMRADNLQQAITHMGWLAECKKKAHPEQKIAVHWMLCMN